jgi:ABC-type glycerol-3-phosphate transport system substrate-binding protein
MDRRDRKPRTTTTPGGPDVSRKKKNAPPAEFDPDAPIVPPPADDGARRLLIGFAAVLFFAGFVVALIAVFYRPERLVLVGMDEHETAWFRHAIADFADRHHANLKVVPYRDAAQFDSLLAADGKRRRIVLAEAPFERLAALVDSGRVVSLAKLPGAGDPDALLGVFTPAAAAPARIAGRSYYVPSRLTTLCLAYSKARVADAVEHAGEVRSLVEGWLRAANGSGLPGDYVLEANPSQWDSYDVLMVAAYWANQPFIDGTAPRVGHAVAPSGALAFELAARAFSMGALPDEVLALDSFGVRDALAWESLFFEHGLYDTSMVAERWTPADVADRLAAGRVWLATLEPDRILRLHGLAADSSRTKPASPTATDIGLSRMPRGVSLELKNRFPERAGDPWSARGGHWWCVPTGSPDPRLALDIMRHVTAPVFQAEAARTLGWIPTRADLVDDLSNVISRPDEFALARPAMRQLYDFGRPLPGSARWPDAGDAFARAWEDACVRRRLRAPLELAEALRLAQGGR